MERLIPSGRFRRRLTVAFVLVAGVAAGTIGLGAFLLVREVRTTDFVERSVRDAAANYRSLVAEGPPESEARLETVVARLEGRAADATVVLGPGAEFRSDPSIGTENIPRGLLETADDADGTEPAYVDPVTVDDQLFLVAMTPQLPGGQTFVFFYSHGGLEGGLQDLATILWRLWLVVLVGGALIGNLLARRTLRPVSEASKAAHALEEGLLDTRLPVVREDEFGAWAASFNRMAEALQTKINELLQARERERRFTSDVSHELRTPLTALLGSVSMLEGNLDDMAPDVRWTAERIIRETRRLSGLVDELLEVSRLTSGRESLHLSEVDLGRITAQVIQNYGWQGIVHFEPESVVALTDKARVERIVVNLIGNAVEHGRIKPRAELRREGDSACLEVRDAGPGISPDNRPYIFERFFKSDSARGGGTGLGLSIAAANARLLGGSIAVSSEPGSTCFTLVLPLHTERLSADDEGDALFTELSRTSDATRQT